MSSAILTHRRDTYEHEYAIRNANVVGGLKVLSMQSVNLAMRKSRESESHDDSDGDRHSQAWGSSVPAQWISKSRCCPRIRAWDWLQRKVTLVPAGPAKVEESSNYGVVSAYARSSSQ